MAMIEVHMIEGRSAARKRALIRNLTDTLQETLGVRREGIRVLLREYPATNWGIAGEPHAGRPPEPD